jgi:hypothetical protein
MLPKKLPLSCHEYGVRKSNGPVEEGLYRHLMSVVPPETKYCIEFGARDGTTAHTRGLVEDHGFSALYIEGDPEAAERLKENFSDYPGVVAIQSFITAENIESLFEQAGVPQRPYLLTIDIDGNDYYVWKAITHFHPIFVCVEFNASYGPESDFVIDYDPEFMWQKDDYFGAAITPFVQLAKDKGYELIHVTSGGDNLFFVDREYFTLFGIGDNSPENMYQLPQYGRNGRASNGKGHPVSVKNSGILARIFYRIRYRVLSLVRRIIKYKMKQRIAANRKSKMGK